jgi:hypothetical protein
MSEKAKKHLQDLGIHPTEPIYWDTKKETISLDSLLDSYHQKQLEEILPKLEEISEGKGSYDTDQFKHAQNCIRDMKLLALEIISTLTKTEKDEN